MGEDAEGVARRDHRLPIVDGLRAVAVVAVVLFHTFPAMVGGGFIGVDIFFVISGFVIALRYLPAFTAGSIGPVEFFARRIRRLVPAYFVLVVVVSILAFGLLLPRDLYNYGQSLAAQGIYAQNIVFWYQGDYFDPGQVKPLLHTWSLAVEEQYYLIFPFAIILFRRRPLLGAVVATIVFAASVGLGYALAPTTPKTAFFMLPTRIWQFLAGVFAAVIFARGGGRAAAAPNLVGSLGFTAAIIAVLVSIFGFDETTGFPSVQALLATGATALICVTQTYAHRPITAALRSGLAQHIGRISYSWYLWRWPVTVFFFVEKGRMPHLGEGLVCLLVGYALGVMSYRLIERPGQQSAWLATRRGTATLLVGFLVFSATVGGYFVASKGVLERYPPAERALYFAQMDRAPYRCAYVNRLRLYDAEICSLNNIDGPGGLLVIGDSHADQSKEALAALGRAAGRPVYLTKRNCKIIDYGTSDFCSDDVWEGVRADIRRFGITEVVAISYWPADAKPEVYAAAARRVTAAGVTLHVEMPLPTGAFFDPAERLAGRITAASRYTLDDYRRDNAAQLRGMAEIAKTSDVRLIDPVPYLCGTLICDFASGGLPLYSDTHHLSSGGVRRLTNLYRTVIERP